MYSVLTQLYIILYIMILHEMFIKSMQDTVKIMFVSCIKMDFKCFEEFELGNVPFFKYVQFDPVTHTLIRIENRGNWF